MELKSDEDILRFAWGQWNGTNRIGQVSIEHILLSVGDLQEMGPRLHSPSVGQIDEHGGVSSWGKSVFYQPTLNDLLKKNGRLRFFKLELLVRFNTCERACGAACLGRLLGPNARGLDARRSIHHLFCR